MRALAAGLNVHRWCRMQGNAMVLALAGACMAAPACADTQQHALDTRSLADCLKGWDIEWRLPYFPQLILNQCAEDKPAGKTKIANAPERRVTAAMQFSTDAMPRFSTESLPYGDAPQALYTHFDKLLAAQGFTRTEGPVMEADDNKSYPSSAAYERARGTGSLRVEYSMHSSHAFNLVLEQRGALQDVAKLPVPKADLDMLMDGAYAPLFALPGAKLVDEKVIWDVQYFSDQPEQVSMPARQFRYLLAEKASASDAVSAWQAALKQAGWTATGKVTSSRGDKAMQFKLAPNRLLEADLSAFDDRGQTTITVVLIDPSLWATILPNMRLMQWTEPWEFSPEFDAAGKPTEDTRRKLFALTRQTFAENTKKPYIIPIVAEKLLADKSAIDKARKAAHWMRDEMQRVGVNNGGIYAIDIDPQVKPPALPRFGVTIGARLTYLNCRINHDSRPDGVVKTCSCQLEGKAFSTQPGECKS